MREGDSIGKKWHLLSCVPDQSVDQSVLAAKASEITCLSSACTSDLLDSVIWLRHFATHSLCDKCQSYLMKEDSPTYFSCGGHDSVDMSKEDLYCSSMGM